MATEDLTVSHFSRSSLPFVIFIGGKIQYNGYVIPKGSMVFQNTC